MKIYFSRENVFIYTPFFETVVFPEEAREVAREFEEVLESLADVFTSSLESLESLYGEATRDSLILSSFLTDLFFLYVTNFLEYRDYYAFSIMKALRRYKALREALFKALPENPVDALHTLASFDFPERAKLGRFVSFEVIYRAKLYSKKIKIVLLNPLFSKEFTLKVNGADDLCEFTRKLSKTEALEKGVSLLKLVCEGDKCKDIVSENLQIYEKCEVKRKKFEYTRKEVIREVVSL